MKQGDIIKAEVEDINNEGEGVVRVGGFVVFVKDALPGETASFRIVSLKKNYGTAKTLERFTTSPDRVSPPCRLFGKCGGCQCAHMSYDAQLSMKRQALFDALTRIGGVKEPNMADCVPSPEVTNYRNKASVPAQSARGERFRAGFYKPRSHDIVPYGDCPLLSPKINETLKSLIAYFKRSPFHGVSESGVRRQNEVVRHIVVRSARFTDDALCAVVTNRALSKKEILHLSRAAQEIKGLSGMACNINASRGNFIWGEKTVPIYGSQTVTERLGDYGFTFEASSFFQVNSLQALALYKKAASAALERSPKKILELYAGVGSLTAFLASGGACVSAVESWRPAAKYILQNARSNGFGNVKAFNVEAEEAANALSGEKFDVVVLDPPRVGCGEKVISALAKIAPESIVYVSCNPATLARDARLLMEAGYKFNSSTPFDMFPQTGHVETVVLMSRETT